MPLRAPLLIIRPFIVFTVVAALIAPLILMVVMPLRAPAVVTFKPLEANVKVPVPLPIEVFEVPVALMEVAPVTVKPPSIVAPFTTARPLFKVANPATVKVPPSVVAPVPTVNVLVPEILVLPSKVAAPPTFKLPPSVDAPLPTVKVFVPVTDVAPRNDTAPVPVANVPEPFWVMLLLLPIVRLPLKVLALVTANVPATLKLPPKVVAPVPTVKVLAPVTLVLPLMLTVPVPVLNVPEPVCVKLPLKLALTAVKFPLESILATIPPALPTKSTMSWPLAP